MAPAKKQTEVNPWGWVDNVEPDKIGKTELLKAYRIQDFKVCSDGRNRNCKRNPLCYFGLGERKWVESEEEGSEGEDDGFREKGEFAGLQNLGATCYVNSLLQLWYHNPILRAAILKWKPNIVGENEAEVYKPNGPVAQLQAMFARMKISKRSKIDPSDFVKSLQLDTGEQQDAQEFSKLFLDMILKSLKKCPDPAVSEAVFTAFRGELQYQTECLKCHNKTSRPENFTELELNVRKNLEESLDELLQDETLSGSDQYYCSNCDQKNDATRKTQLLKLPPVLNLQLMRFVFDRETYRKKKVTTTIQFPEELDMGGRLTNDDDDSSSADNTYHLCAVLIHNGPSASSGHYVAQVKDLRTGTWHKCNDETVNLLDKSKSKKLVLKEDEGSDSDKGGQKKPRPPKTHTSHGAYMLVYIARSVAANPSQDPELWPYLEQLVRREDETYEEEVMKLKSEKDYDASQKEQRKREICALYPNLEILKTPNGSEKGDGDSKDTDQPPKKLRRTNEVQKSRNDSSSSTNGSGKDAHAAGGVSNGSLKRKSKNGRDVSNQSVDTPDVADLEFIPVDWMTQWLDPDNPVPPLETELLLCSHKKLRPPSPTSSHCLYRAVPKSFVDEYLVQHIVSSPRLLGQDAFCYDCVKEECSHLRDLHQLENDYKMFVDSNKKIELVNPKDPSQSFEYGKKHNLLWISKEASRNWKRWAKNIIESRYKRELPVNEDGENSEGVPDPDSDEDISSNVINKDITCSHRNLLPHDGKRKLITVQSWEILKMYFPDAIELQVVQYDSECATCIGLKNNDLSARNQLKDEAQTQKQTLSDLYYCKSRADFCTPGKFYVVEYDFVDAWKKFVRDPAKYPQPEGINNNGLICRHDKFMYSLDMVSQWYETEENQKEIYILVKPEVWKAVRVFYDKFDVEIKVVITESGETTYHPELCGDCVAERWAGWEEERLEYVNQPIHIVRRDMRDSESKASEDEDDMFIKVPVPSNNTELPTKRPRIARDPTSWTNSLATLPTTNSSSNINNTNNGVRRSARSRKQKDSKTYKVSSSNTLKDLKLMIVKDFHAGLSDQHLYFKDFELDADNLSLTLKELRIPANSTLYLKIDTEQADDQDDPLPPSIEVGFQGTLLMGGDDTSREATMDDDKSENSDPATTTTVPTSIKNDMSID